MERRYQRQYENFSSVIPRPEDFPVLDGNLAIKPESTEKEVNNTSPVTSSFPSLLSSLKSDDILLIAVLILMLTDEKKDMSTIITIAVLFLSEFFT